MKFKRIFVSFIKITFAMLVVFFASFFITLALRSAQPLEYMMSLFESEEPVVNNNYKFNNLRAQRINPNVSFSEKVNRIMNIDAAVTKKIIQIRHYVYLRDIPRALRQAVIAVEDSRFYSHNGFDVGGITRATVTNIEAGHIEEGGSTITQQLVKNLFLSQEQTFSRKVEELFLAMSVERNFTKDKIIEMYLNTIYFGAGFYGIYEASHGYFDKEPKELTLGECAMLAGIPNAPSLYSPYENFTLAKKRQSVVIDAMVRTHLLSAYEARRAHDEEIFIITP